MDPIGHRFHLHPDLDPQALQQEAYQLFGRISHMHDIEPSYTNYILTKYERQFNISFRELYKISPEEPLQFYRLSANGGKLD